MVNALSQAWGKGGASNVQPGLSVQMGWVCEGMGTSGGRDPGTPGDWAAAWPPWQDGLLADITDLH